MKDHRLHMETAQSNSLLTGSADFWSNTKSGMLFDTLTKEDWANPVFHLDEVDKVATPDYDPLASLYALLEPGTAKNYCDASYPWITLDASAVVYICTANDRSRMPAPILNRMREFDIALPSDDQARRVVRHLFHATKAELPASIGAMRLSAKAVDILVTASPRQCKRALREAIGRALYYGRRSVLPEDIGLRSDADLAKPGMGFL